jgi:beta-glucosidase
MPSVSGEYFIGGEGFSAYKIFLNDELMGEWDDVHHPRMHYKTLDLVAGKKI